MSDEDAHYAYGYETSGGAGWFGFALIILILIAELL